MSQKRGWRDGERGAAQAAGQNGRGGGGLGKVREEVEGRAGSQREAEELGDA